MDHLLHAYILRITNNTKYNYIRVKGGEEEGGEGTTSYLVAPCNASATFSDRNIFRSD